MQGVQCCDLLIVHLNIRELIDTINAKQQGTCMLQRLGNTNYFFDDYFDLFIEESNCKVNWFQLCYDKYDNQRAITWARGEKLRHEKVDENSRSFYSMTPILEADGYFDHVKVVEMFRQASIGIEPWIARTIIEVLEGYTSREVENK
jgi:hypothetical protein